MSTRDAWLPEQYHRFRAERSRPFHDLLALVHPCPGGRALDLGCGTGELTVALHRSLGCAETLGIDRSGAMLAEAARVAGTGVAFQQGDLRSVEGLGMADVVFSNAALQWVPDHRVVLAAWVHLLQPGGQLAVQVPANVDHPAHAIEDVVAHESPFLEALDGEVPPDVVHSVLGPEEYAVLLDELGFGEQHVRLQVYGHHLAETAEVVEWMKGTSLVRFRERLPAELFDRFVERYRSRLLEVLGDQRPYFYAFKRILMWGRLG